MSEPARRLADGLRRAVERATSRVSAAIHRRLVDDTPRDTGFAANNWIQTLGSPRQGTAGTYEEATLGRLDPGPREAGVAAVQAYRLEDGDVHDANSVDYIQKLNAGSSPKAPAAFVQRAIVRGIEEASA